VLVSARDPGAAKSILPILQHGQSDSSLDFTIIAQGAAVDIFGDAGFEVRPFNSPTVASPSSAGAERLLDEARDCLRQTQPEVILTGQSAPDIGVDEALIAVSTTPWTFTVQDVDGLITPGFGKLAPYYFVSTPFAAAATQKRAAVETFVVGSLRHANYGDLDPCVLRHEGRLLIGKDEPLIGFYGQPAWHLAGYARTLEMFAECLREVPAPFGLVYRRHPKETAADTARTHSIFSGRGVPLIADPASRVETSLCAVDLVAVCYSSCGVDQVHLQRQSQQPLNTSLFLMFEADIRANYLRECGVNAPPEIDAGLALGITRNLSSPRVLSDTVRRALRPETRRQTWELVHQQLTPAPAAPAKVVEHLARLAAAC